MSFRERVIDGLKFIFLSPPDGTPPKLGPEIVPKVPSNFYLKAATGENERCLLIGESVFLYEGFEPNGQTDSCIRIEVYFRAGDWFENDSKSSTLSINIFTYNPRAKYQTRISGVNHNWSPENNEKPFSAVQPKLNDYQYDVEKEIRVYENELSVGDVRIIYKR